MAIKYKNPDNIPFSGWIVSGKEADFVLDCLNNEELQKESMRISSLNMEKIRRVMAVS